MNTVCILPARSVNKQRQICQYPAPAPPRLVNIIDLPEIPVWISPFLLIVLEHLYRLLVFFGYNYSRLAFVSCACFYGFACIFSIWTFIKSCFGYCNFVWFIVWQMKTLFIVLLSSVWNALVREILIMTLIIMFKLLWMLFLLIHYLDCTLLKILLSVKIKGKLKQN